MDYVKEIERIQREQEARLKLGRGVPPELRGATGQTSEALAKVPAMTGHPLAAAVTKAREEVARKARGNRTAARSPAAPASPLPPADKAAAQRLAAGIARFALLVPVLVLVGMGLSGVESAWDGEAVHPVDALFVVVPWLLAVAVLQLRRHAAQAILRGGRPAQPGTPPLGSRLRWLGPVVVALVIAAVAASMVFPEGVPLGRWLDSLGSAGS